MNDIKYDTFISEHFSFKWVIKDDLYLNLRLVNHKKHCDTYFLFPLFNMHLKKYIDENNCFIDISEIMISIVTFYDKSFYDLTTSSFFKEEINRHIENMNFDLLKKFTKMVIVKTLDDVAKKTIPFNKEFIDSYLNYAKLIKRYDLLKEQSLLLIEDIENELEVLKSPKEFQKLLNNSVNAAIDSCNSLDLTSYERILKFKIDKTEAIEGLLFIKNLLNDIGSNNKKFAKIKSYNHAFDFISSDEIYLYRDTDKEIYPSFAEGLINGYMSLCILNSMNNNDLKRIERYKSVLIEFEDNNKEILSDIEDLIKLYSSKTHKQYLPILAISNSFFGLSEPKIISLANYILTSVNKNTIKTKFEYLNYIDFDIRS